ARRALCRRLRPLFPPMRFMVPIPPTDKAKKAPALPVAREKRPTHPLRGQRRAHSGRRRHRRRPGVGQGTDGPCPAALRAKKAGASQAKAKCGSECEPPGPPVGDPAAGSFIPLCSLSSSSRGKEALQSCVDDRVLVATCGACRKCLAP